MTLENEKQFLLLLSSYSLNATKSNPTKSDVLDNIDGHHWISLTNADLQYKTNRKELVWRNDLAFVRKHLEQNGWYKSGVKNDWSITELGLAHLRNLCDEVAKTTSFSKITNQAMLFAQSIYNNLSISIISTSNLNNLENLKNINGKEKEILIKTRVNQGSIKQQALKKYNCKCVLCGSKLKATLIASHIKRWADSNATEKGDLDNILLLCPNHDALFDKHLISFDNNANILINSKLDDFDKTAFNIHNGMHLNIAPNKAFINYMNYHRAIFIQKNN